MHDAHIEQETAVVSIEPEEKAMQTRFARLSRSPELVLSVSFVAVLLVYLSAASIFA
jgi:hypothetical protein